LLREQLRPLFHAVEAARASPDELTGCLYATNSTYIIDVCNETDCDDHVIVVEETREVAASGNQPYAARRAGVDQISDEMTPSQY
jgi:hypothetical protein